MPPGAARTIQVIPPAAIPVLLGALAFFGAYLAYEAWRWFSGNRSILTPGQFRRRMATGILLELDLILWLMANPFLASDLMMALPSSKRAAWALLYLLHAVLLAVIPMMLAVREAAFITRQYTRMRGEIVKNLGHRDSPGSNGSAP
jgi:hypothetical protein